VWSDSLLDPLLVKIKGCDYKSGIAIQKEGLDHLE
jgi:hypothetical protein